jgi:hypothetical protein
MNYKDYYKELAELQSEFKDLVKKKLSISDKTFYNKINSDSWSDLERTVLADAKAEINKNILSL